MNTSEARISELENKVAVLTSEKEKKSNGSEDDLYFRISKLESKVSQLTSMNEALVNLTNYLQTDIAALKETGKRKFDSGSGGESLQGESPAKKRNLSARSTFRDESPAKKRNPSSNSTYTGNSTFKGEFFDEAEAVEVYTDGSCFNNGRHDACAGIGVYWGPNSEDNLSERLTGRQTNNHAEIKAAVRALQQAIRKNIRNLVVYTDSMFLINCITKWIYSWKKNGWRKSDGGQVINQEELEELDALREKLVVKWVHVDAHKGIPGNEAADKLAVEGAKGKKDNIKNANNANNTKNVRKARPPRQPRQPRQPPRQQTKKTPGKTLMQQIEEDWLCDSP